MRKWLSLIAATLTVAVVVPAVAGAAARHHKCSFNLTALTAPVKSTGNPPLNGTQTRAEFIDGKLCGKQFHGAGRLLLTFTAPGKGPVVTVTFGPRGSFSTSGSFTSVRQPDGSVKISGHGKITRGTGVYKGATGSYSATGTIPPNSNVATLHFTGTLKR